jgi:hypothetical protein
VKQNQQLELFDSGTGDTNRKKADNLSVDIDVHLRESDIAGAKLAIHEQEVILKKMIAEKKKVVAKK